SDLSRPAPAEGGEWHGQRDEQESEPDRPEFTECFQIEIVCVQRVGGRAALLQPAERECTRAVSQQRVALDHLSRNRPIVPPAISAAREEAPLGPPPRRRKRLRDWYMTYEPVEPKVAARSDDAVGKQGESGGAEDGDECAAQRI